MLSQLKGHRSHSPVRCACMLCSAGMHGHLPRPTAPLAHFGNKGAGPQAATYGPMLPFPLCRSRQQQGGQNILMYCVYCCLECVYSLIEYLTKFATVCMAITVRRGMHKDIAAVI